MARKHRGTMDYRNDSTNKIVVTRWNDNSVVTLASNCQVVNPVGKAKWYSGKESKIIEIDEPYVVRYYNQNMGGANRMVKNISFYRIPVRIKKWWMPLFIFMPDAAIQNAWLLYRKSDASKLRPLNLLGFRREFVDICRRKYSSRQRGVGSVERPILVASKKLVKVPEPVRFDGQGNYPGSSLTQRRCTYCGMRVKFICEKCNVGLHIDFFSLCILKGRKIIKNDR